MVWGKVDGEVFPRRISYVDLIIFGYHLDRSGEKIGSAIFPKLNALLNRPPTLLQVRKTLQDGTSNGREHMASSCRWEVL